MIGIDTKLDRLLHAALTEDIGSRDLTSSLIPADQHAKADAIFKEEGLLCGLPIAERLFRLVDENLRFLPVASDGEKIDGGRAIFYVEGKCRSILAAERVALNFLGHMSAVATMTRSFADRVEGTPAQIFDTRKTTPLFRILDRYAVKKGGGQNHRSGLYDGVLIKENHLHALSQESLETIVGQARSRVSKKTQIGVEVRNLKELASALKAPTDYILLDNFSVPNVKEAVALRTKMNVRIPLEVSGGVKLNNVAEYAACGVERISVGALTHSIQVVDISLNLL